MANKKSRILRDLFYVLGLAIFFFMAYKFGFDNILKNLKQTGWWFIPIIALWIVVYLLNSFCLQIILRDGSDESKKVNIWKILRLTISAYAINYITPLAIGGEPYKAMELKKDIGGHKATTSVLLYVMMHYVSHFLFWMLSVPLFLIVVPVIPAGVKVVLWGMIIGTMALIYWGYTVYTTGIINKALTIGSKIPFFGKKIKIYKEKNKERFDEMDFLIGDLYKNRKRDFFLSLGIELLSRIVWSLEIFFMVLPLSYSLNLAQTVLIYSFATLVANIFFFAPMQMGTREGGFALAVSFLSIPAGIGIYIGLCTRIRELFWILIGFALVRIKPKDHKSSVD
ncbi:MAG: lysylphosphatidylglycerol synthase transmembrane domain-containing protein [Paludibacteraceae bacterium]